MDNNVAKKEHDKVETYQALAQEIRKMYKVRTQIIPIVMGALGLSPSACPVM
jgi:hypothetical protein